MVTAKRVGGALLLVSLLAPADPLCGQSPSRPGVAPRPLCRAPEALNLFTMTVRHVLQAHHPQASWPVFQVPCDPLASVSDASRTAILVVDPAFATEQDVLQYGFIPFPFAPPTLVTPQPDDPFARVGRLLLKPTLTAVPSIWTKGALDAAHADALRLAAAAGAVQALAAFEPLCGRDAATVPEQLLVAAELNSRHRPDYHLFFEAALQEHRAMRGQAAALAPAATATGEALRGVVVPGLRCDVDNRARFSLMPFGPGATSLARTAEHIERAVAGVRSGGRSDLGQLNLARVCALQAVTDMLQSNRLPSCNASDYGLWTSAYAPLLHAAEVKVLETSR